MAPLLSWLALLLLGPPSASGCGVMVHSEVARRAPLSMQLPDKGAEEAVRRYPYVVDAGAPFPDYLYTCGTDHDDGEYAHWHQFHHHFVDYIRQKHPQWNNGDEHGAKLVAFLMGLTSHYIADVNWHGLGQAQTGFIEQVGLQDMGCGGDLCATAHNTCDVGGEFVINMQMGASNLDPLRWWIPTADIVAVFALAGIEVQPKWINECALLFAAELLGVRLAEPIEWAVYTRRSAMLEQSLEDFFIGGLDDSAAWSALVWSEVVDWLHGNGTAPTLRRAAQLAARPTRTPRRGGAAAAAGRAQLRVVEVAGGAVEIAAQDAPRGAPAAADEGGGAAAALSYLGSAVAACDLDGDGTLDPVVGAPGVRAAGRPLVGAVQVLLGGAAGAEREVLLQGEAILARFGSALACADLNGNGVPELFVAAPTEGPWEVRRGPDPLWNFENQSYFGAVHAFEWNGTALAPAWTWRSDSFLGVCGSALAAVGGHLVVGCPFASAGAGTSGRVVALDHTGALVWEARGYSLGARLGASLAALPALGLVAVGAPGLRVAGAGGSAATGAVLLMDGATGALVARLDSSEAKAQFGRALAADGGTLWVGAPGANATVLGASLPDAGRVDQFAVSRTNGTVTLVKQRSLEAFFREAFAEFGLSLAPLADGQGVAIGAPLADFERGRVHLFSPAGVRLPSHAGTSPHGRFGAAMAAMGGTLLVGAPKESTGPRVLAGAPRQGLLHRVQVGGPLELQV